MTKLILPSFSQASAACDEELRRIPALCAALVSNWKFIHDYLTKMAPTQLMQGVKNKMYTFCFNLLGLDRIGPSSFVPTATPVL